VSNRPFLIKLDGNKEKSILISYKDLEAGKAANYIREKYFNVQSPEKSDFTFHDIVNESKNIVR
jgi:hypothetical protein